ncbi:MAG: acyloxyacyl hydrolase [Bacteroidales bacterium]|nr:acyloxyacyl hydrolase [Bacteroidales bacterium]
MKKSFLFLAFLIAPIFIFSQTQTNLWNDPRNIWEIDARLGKYFPFEERHAYMKQLPQYGLDLRVARQTDGRAQWEQDFNYPVYGAFLRLEKNHVDSIQYKYRDENGRECETWRPLGDCISTGAFVNGHLYRGNRWSFDYDLMGGLSFWTKHGDEFIGSVVNVHLAIDAGPTLQVTDQLDLLVRYQFSHSSNAALRLPNCGINVFSWLAGVRYHPNGRPSLLPKEQPRPAFQKSNALFVSNAVGLLQTNEWMRSYQAPDGTMLPDMPSERPYYFADVIQFGLHRQFHPKFSYDVALDFGWTGETKRMYEKAIQNYNDGHEYYTGDNAIPLMEYSFARGLHLAPSAMFEINYNRFAFCLGGAYYLWHGIYYGTDQRKTWGLAESSESNFEDAYLPPCYRTFYGRLGFKYYLGENRNMFVGSFMKVHEVVIDYAEFTFGWHLFQWEDK